MAAYWMRGTLARPETITGTDEARSPQVDHGAETYVRGSACMTLPVRTYLLS
jgi:hypothetical protein